jgi:hypothetical protein
MEFLRQSTATTVKIGPFLDETDGKTAETGLTVTAGDVRLTKNGGDFAQKNESSSCTHDELGYYNCSLNTTDTGTLGRLKLAVHESGALPIWHDYMVMPAIAYDAFFGSGELQVDAEDIADAVLARAVSNVEDTANEFSLAAMILATFKWALAGTAWTVKKTGGATFTTRTITTDSGANPVTGVT